MKNLFLISFLILCSSSCVTIEFETPQPKKVKALKEYPKELKGKYIVQIVDEDSEPSEDTLLITDSYYQESHNNKRLYLSDSCILNNYEDNYIINFKTSSDINWTVAILKKENSNIMVYGLFDEDKNEDRFISDINSITNVQRIRKPTGDKSYVINPSKKEFNEIINQGYFKPVYKLIEIKE